VVLASDCPEPPAELGSALPAVHFAHDSDQSLPSWLMSGGRPVFVTSTMSPSRLRS
jgi:hypothetical protein